MSTSNILITFNVCPYKYLYKHTHKHSFSVSIQNVHRESTNKEIVFKRWPVCPDFFTILYAIKETVGGGGGGGVRKKERLLN
jgi:hypothetical protein